MVMTRTKWETLQAKLPEEDRMSYEDYLQSEGTFAPPVSRAAQGESGVIGAVSIGSQMTPEITESIQNIPSTTEPKRYYNYYTGEWVNDPSEIKPREGMGGPESGGGTIQVTESATGPTGPTGPGGSPTGPTGPGGSPTGPTGPGATGPTGPASSTTYTASDGKTFTDQVAYVMYENKLRENKLATQAKEAQELAGRQSAFDFLLNQFSQYGLQALVEPLRDLIKQGVPASEFTIRLRDTDAYKKRFAANQLRINRGLRALSEADYIKLEDDYQDVMRRYGLPQSYYSRGDMGRQEGFEKFIAGDVSAPELEKRIQMAQERVMDADPMIGQTLREFYPSITNGEILAFALDPDRAMTEINRKITSAEIGAAQYGAKLAASRIRAEELAAAGVTGKQYQQAAPTIADIATRGSTLAQIYEQRPFGQIEAEQETLGISGAAEARERRRRLTQLEQASFAGQAGAAGGALGRERAGAF